MKLLTIKCCAATMLALPALIGHTKDDASAETGIYYNNGAPNYEKTLIDSSTGSGGTSIRYTSFAASGMSSVRSTQGYDYSGGGCLQAKDSNLFIDHSLDLPIGSRLVSVSYLMNDNSNTENLRGYLYTSPTFSNFQSYETGVAAQPGIVSLGGFFDFTLSDNTEAITTRLMITDATGSSDSEICGLRIGFIPPDVASDVIFVNNFFR